MLNETDSSQEEEGVQAQGAGGGSGTPLGGSGYIHVTPQEKEAIDRVNVSFSLYKEYRFYLFLEVVFFLMLGINDKSVGTNLWSKYSFSWKSIGQISV